MPLALAFLTPEYVSEANFDGGLANYLYRVAQGFARRGHRVEIFTRSRTDDTIVHDGVTVHRIRMRQGFFSRMLKRATRCGLNESLDILTFSSCLRKRFLARHRIEPFDVVQASSYLATGIVFTLRKGPVPVVTRVSSFEPLWRTYYQKPVSVDQKLVEWLEVLAMKRSEGVYAPSRLLAKAITDAEAFRVDVINPPFSIETRERDDSVYRAVLDGKKYLLFYGNLGYLKGAGVLAEALPKIFSLCNDLRFAFVGRNLYGPNGKSMLDHLLVKAGRFRDRIEYLGILRHPQLYPVLDHAHAVVLPSLVDNVPNTMLEAMALGKVVVGTRGASFDEFITHGLSGFLVERGNPPQLARIVARAWRMEESERNLMGRAARERIALLDPDTMCSALEHYFVGVLDRSLLQDKNPSGLAVSQK